MPCMLHVLLKVIDFDDNFDDHDSYFKDADHNYEYL